MDNKEAVQRTGLYTSRSLRACGFICEDEVGLCYLQLGSLFRSETPSCAEIAPLRRAGGHQVRTSSFQ